jgi:hypothetical protein
VLISASAYSQDSTKYIIGSGISGSYNSYKHKFHNSNRDSYTIGVKGIFGYKILKNKIVGLDLEVLNNNHEIAIQIAPFFRYIFKNDMFTQIHIGTNISRTKYTYGKNETDILFITGIGAGYDIKLTDNVSLQPQFKCSFAKDFETGYYSVTSFFSLDFVHKF